MADTVSSCVMKRRLLLALACVFAASTAARADEPAYVPPEFMATLPPLPERARGGEPWRMDLAEALQIALHENLGIVLERAQVDVARLGIDVARGEFEPTVSASADHGRSDSPPVTVQEGGAGSILSFINDDWSLSIAQRIATGARLQLSFGNGRALSSAGTAVEPLNYRSQLQVSLTQPVLRGFSTDLVVPRVDVLRAKIASDRERAQLAITAADIVERTEDAYWDVVQALFRYDVEVHSEQRAEEQIALTERQIAAGMLPPSDLIQAESTVAQRKLGVVQAEQGVEAAWDALRSMLNLPRDRWSRAIVPVDLPQFAPTTTQPEEALQVALTHRPELAQMKLDLDSALLAVRVAENAKLPEIDVGVTGALIGQDSTYSGALDGLGRTDTHAYTAMVNLTWTPLNRTAIANAEIARRNHAMATTRREQLIQQVWFAVRDAVRNQDNTARQVAAAARSRELTTQSLELEQRKFLTNQTTNFVVSQRQEELATAQLAELSAVVAHKKAVAALLRATGRLLDDHRVVLDAK